MSIAHTHTLTHTSHTLTHLHKLTLCSHTLTPPHTPTLTDESIAVDIQHLSILALCGFHHESVCHWPGHSGGVETVVLQPLGDINGIHVGSALEATGVQNELVGIESCTQHKSTQ